MKRVFAILAGTLILSALYVFFVEPLWVVPLLERMTPNILYRVKTKQPLVALTFDDGPNPEFTPQVLELLKENDAKATFFLIGERAERNPELVRRILAEGHEVGNHWCRDGSVLLQSEKGFVDGLDRTERAIEGSTDGPTPAPAGRQKSAPTTEGKKQDPGSEGEPGAPAEEKTRTL